MCIENLYIDNNSRLLYLSRFPKLKQKFKCGKCFECREGHSNEYLLRGYYQALETFKKGGFILFDTLTYAEWSVPRINQLLDVKDNFYCFRNSDMVNFMKLLRTRLKRIYNETGTLCTLYTGEYGTDEGCTHRPHYHCIFYYTGGIDFISLSKLINSCWNKGRTDGVDWKGISYVKNKRLFSNVNAYCINQTKYIIKYMQKEAQYQKIIDFRTNKLCKDLFGDNLNYFDKIEARKLRNIIRQSQRCSNGFGSYALNFIDDEQLLNNNNMLKIPDTKNAVKFIPLPTYYKRKLYQNLFYYSLGELDETGKPIIYQKWQWNKRGIEYAKKLEFNSFLQLKNKRRLDIFNSEFREEINHYTNFEELSNYEYLHRYRHGNLSSLYDILNNFNNETDLIYSWGSPKDKCLYGKHYINVIPSLDNATEFKDLNSNKNEILDIILNILDNEKRNTKLGRNKLYFKLKELENKYKHFGLK